MSVDRTVRLSPSELALKLAAREAVKAAGGQDFVASECHRAQSRISDWCSSNVREFMPADVIARIEALGAGAPGHPHITRALARAQGGAFVDFPPNQSIAIGAAVLATWLADIAGEAGDVINAIARGDLAAELGALAPARRSQILGEVDQTVDLLVSFAARLRHSAEDPDTS